MKIGFLGLLALLFIGLKLGNVIAWSWFWVLSPLWIGVVLFILILIIVAVWQEVDPVGYYRWKMGL